MLPYVLFLVVNMCLLVESNIYNNDNYNIQLNLTNFPSWQWGQSAYRRSLYETGHIFVVLGDQPFAIKVLNYQATGMSVLSCGSPRYSYSTTFTTVNKSGVLNSIVEVPTTTANMTGQWHCTMLRNDSSSVLTLSFRVRVKSSFESRVKIEIGGRFLNTSLTNSSVLEYDEMAIYSYWNGETVDLVCHNEQSNGMIYFKFYDATGKPLIRSETLLKGKDYDSIMFQRTLYTEHNNSMIDCTYVTMKDHIEFSYRVIFIQNIRKSYGNFKVAINNLQLKSDQNSATDDVRVSQYHYIFFPEEDLKITCDPLKDGDLKPNFFVQFRNGYTMKYESEINLSQLGLHFTEKLPITCAAEGRKAHILLIKREHPKFRILGLNWEYLVTQYTESSKHWIIHYRFRAGQELNITCLARDTGTLWLFESTKTQNESVGAGSISQIFKMGDTHNNSRIICQDGKTDTDYKQQVIIVLHMDRVPSRGISSTTSLPTDDAPNLPSADAPEKISDKIMLEPSNSISPSDVMRHSKFIRNIVMGCVVILLVLIVMGCLVYYCRCKNSRIRQTDEIRVQTFEPTSPVDMASTSVDAGNNSNTCDHEYHYIDKIRPTKKLKLCPLPEDNEDKDNLEYDYAYASAIPSEVKQSLPPHIDSAQNNTIYYWIHQ